MSVWPATGSAHSHSRTSVTGSRTMHSIHVLQCNVSNIFTSTCLTHYFPPHLLQPPFQWFRSGDVQETLLQIMSHMTCRVLPTWKLSAPPALWMESPMTVRSDHSSFWWFITHTCITYVRAIKTVHYHNYKYYADSCFGLYTWEGRVVHDCVVKYELCYAGATHRANIKTIFAVYLHYLKLGLPACIMQWHIFGCQCTYPSSAILKHPNITIAWSRLQKSGQSQLICI